MQYKKIQEKKKLSKFAVPILSMIVVLLVFSLGFLIGRSGFNVVWEEGEFNYSFKGRLYPEEKEIDFGLFWEVWDKLENTYVDKTINEQDMFYGAIKGIVASLKDPATRFFTPSETEDYEVGKSGKFDGIGIEMGYLNSQVVIKKIFDNSPASLSEIAEGDIIIKVDGEDMSNLDISDYATKIRGENGTNVKITVVRSGQNFDIDIIRGEVYVESIDWEILKDDIALISVRRFTENSFSSFVLLWDKVVNEVGDQDPEGIIIDLRGNGGGYLDGAVYLGGEFLDKGDVVLYVQNREGKKEASKVNRVGKFRDIPLVILVDSGTASSSEIFAGALQYYNRALIVGEETYGKGTAQDVEKPATWGGASIHITTQKWLLPDKRWINHDDPICPDIEVEISIEQIKKGEDLQLDRAKEELIKQ